MATHSSNLAKKIPWREDPDGLQSVRLQKVGHDWATKQQINILQNINVHMHYIIFLEYCKVIIIIPILWNKCRIQKGYLLAVLSVSSVIKPRWEIMLLLTLYYGWDGKESACNKGDPDSIPESGRSSGEGNGNPLQDSCLKHSTDRGAWQATVHEVTKSQTWLGNYIMPVTALQIQKRQWIQTLYASY